MSGRADQSDSDSEVNGFLCRLETRLDLLENRLVRIEALLSDGVAAMNDIPQATDMEFHLSHVYSMFIQIFSDDFINRIWHLEHVVNVEILQHVRRMESQLVDRIGRMDNSIDLLRIRLDLLEDSIIQIKLALGILVSPDEDL